LQCVASLLTRMKPAAEQGGRNHGDVDGNYIRVLDAFGFSDLTVRGTEVPGAAELVDFLSWKSLYVGELQLAFLRERVLVRGGICFDDIAVDRERQIVFGPALVKSYKLESEYAIFPRIVTRSRTKILSRFELRHSIT
jgi:hypothetical protein